MNTDTLLQVLINQEELRFMKTEDAEELVRRYPYFEAARFALLKKLKLEGDYRFQEQLNAAAVHCSDRKTMFLYIERSNGVGQTDEVLVSNSPGSVVLPSPTGDDPLEKDQEEGKTVLEVLDSTGSALEVASTEVGSQEVQEESIKLEEPDTSLPITAQVILPEEQRPNALPEKDFSEPMNLPSPINTPTPPVQRKPRIQWSPDQSIEAPNDILSQILAYPDLGKKPTEEPKPHAPQTGPRSFNDWLRATKANTPASPTTEASPTADLVGKEAPKASFFNPVEMARKSVEDRDDVVSETLAKVYINQGDTNRAIRIYQKLSLLYPEKSAYFAALVEKIVKPS